MEKLQKAIAGMPIHCIRWPKGFGPDAASTPPKPAHNQTNQTQHDHDDGAGRKKQKGGAASTTVSMLCAAVGVILLIS